MNNKIAVGNPINGFGALSEGDAGVANLDRIISTGIGILTVIGVVFFMFNLITGAISIISAGGDKGKYEEARTKITNSIIGLVVVVAAFFVADVVMVLLGLDGILNLPGIIPTL